MNNKLVSVIVPVYNVEKYLSRCVDSILAQTYQNLEIILVDDGSTDASPAMCDEYGRKEKRILVCHQKNGGLSVARNKGIELAGGEYLVFVDSDDYIHPQMVEILYNGIVENHVMISMCGYKDVTSKLAEKDELYDKYRFSMHEDKELLNYFFDDAEKKIMVVVAWNKMYHRDLFIDCCFPPGKLFEDNYTTPRLLHIVGWIAITETPLYYYFQREDSISKTKNNYRALYDTYDAVEYVSNFMKAIKDEQLISKSHIAIVNTFYIFNRQYGKLQDRQLKSQAHSIYRDVYKRYVREEKRASWRIKYWLMRWVPKVYNFVLRYKE